MSPLTNDQRTYQSVVAQLEDEARRANIEPRSREAVDWFRKRIRDTFRGREFSGSRREEVMQDPSLKSRSKPVMMSGLTYKVYLYGYDPKLKKTLPYYDLFPLTVILGPSKGANNAPAFHGINMHYFPPILRSAIIDTIINGKGLSIPKKYIDAGIKQYLFSHVKTRFIEIPRSELPIITFLPLAKWQKASASQVYTDTRRKLI